MFPVLGARVLVSTPIFYVNASPHVGHLYSVLLADAYARWLRLKGVHKSVWLSTGTDEHGSKVAAAAAAANMEPMEYCSTISRQFSDMCTRFSVFPDRFIRTTDPDHIDTVHWLWDRLRVTPGLIQPEKYEGWYCVSDESFVPAGRVTDGPKGVKVSAESGKKVEWLSEDNLMFSLETQEEKLKAWLENGPIIPEERAREVASIVSAGLHPLSVTRPTERMSWGIPLNDAPEHSFYVWLDALANYLTVGRQAQALWQKEQQVSQSRTEELGQEEKEEKKAVEKEEEKEPEETIPLPDLVHVAGKDILKFHAIHWPSFLLAAGLPAPKRIAVHAHWTVNGHKMSKSTGNVVCPFALADRFGVDAVRFSLLLEGGITNDSDFSDSIVVLSFNGILNDKLGNLFSRTASKSIYRDNIEKPHKLHAESVDIVLSMDCLRSELELSFERFDFPYGTRAIVTLLSRLNSYFERMQPWKLRKDPAQEKLADEVVYVTMEGLRIAGIGLLPIIPDGAASLLDHLMVPENKRDLSFMQYGLTPSLFGLSKSILFTKLEASSP